MKRVYHAMLVGCIVMLTCGAGYAETMEFQQGVLPDASYQHDGVAIASPNSATAGGAATTFRIGNWWNSTANGWWGLFRYDLSALGDVEITGAYIELTSTRGDYMDVGASSDIPDDMPESLTINMYQINPDNYEWIEGTGTEASGASPNGMGEVSWVTQQNDVACWPVSGCTSAGLYPQGHSQAPAVDTYNTYADIIGSGVSTNASANDYWSNLVVTLDFNSTGLAYLQSVVDGGNDAGFLVAPPPEILAVAPAYYGIVSFAMDDNDTAAYRPKLVIEYTAGGGGTVPDVSGMSQSEAEAALEGAGYVVEVEQEASGTVPAGGIIRTEPEAGAALASGSTVTLVISSGSGADVPVAGLLGLVLLGAGCAGSAAALIRKRIGR